MSVFKPSYANEVLNDNGQVETYASWNYQPEISNCQNKWCQNPGQLPTTGQYPEVAQCGSASTMEFIKNTTGGLSGRGVTPCPFGFLQKTPYNTDGTKILFPYDGKYFYKLSPSSIFFDPSRPTFLPPQGEPRSLRRVGYEWRDN